MEAGGPPPSSFPVREELAVSAFRNADDICLVTAEGYERLHSTLERLRGEGRREMRLRLRETREDGDLADNPSLLAVLEEQEAMERQIALLEIGRASCRERV
jgi:hypothetical protein